MNPEIKAKWLEALRSGEYKQGTGSLCTIQEDGTSWYCCLGVLCDLAAKEGVVEIGLAGREIYYGESDSYLPDRVQRWAGIHDGIRPDAHNPRIGPASASLSELNDDQEASFEEIARIIEERL